MCFLCESVYISGFFLFCFFLTDLQLVVFPSFLLIRKVLGHRFLSKTQLRHDLYVTSVLAKTATTLLLLVMGFATRCC